MSGTLSTNQVSDALMMRVKMTHSEFGNVIRLFSSSACFLFTAFLVSLHNHANIYPIAEVEYDHLFTKKSRAAQQLKTKYVTLVTLGRKLSKKRCIYIRHCFGRIFFSFQLVCIGRTLYIDVSLFLSFCS